jgi:hypothetical protein
LVALPEDVHRTSISDAAGVWGDHVSRLATKARQFMNSTTKLPRIAPANENSYNKSATLKKIAPLAGPGEQQ